MTKYIRELLDLPPQVSKGDFVLNLAAGVSATNASATLQNYVVTPQLEACFDQALGFIKSAVDANSSKACYLHGSFGSGKSHFMAVLHLLLQNNPEARSIKELADVVSKHNTWTQGRKILLVPFHMIGSRSMEQGILGQYANYVRRLHPEAPIPGVYLAESLFEDAQSLRTDMGDETFFGKLNEGKGSGNGDGWGSISEGWDGASFDAAITATPGDRERTHLVGDLIAAYWRTPFRILKRGRFTSPLRRRARAFVNNWPKMNCKPVISRDHRAEHTRGWRSFRFPRTSTHTLRP